MREVDLVVVKGKTQPVAIYEVLDFYDESEFPNVMDNVSHFNAGVQHYRNRYWDRSIQSFERALEFNPQDNLCRTYLKRCLYLQRNDPGEEWNGVWVMKTK